MKFTTVLKILLCSVLLPIRLFAQPEPCHFDEQSQVIKAENPSIARAWKNAEDRVRKSKLESGSMSYTVTIPVVVHVIYHLASENISDAQVQSQIDVLNEDYRKLNADTSLVRTLFKPFAGDAEIEFCLASRDPNGDSTTGITRTYSSVTDWGCADSMKFSAYGGADGWPGDQYLNIWVCNLNCANGYAYFPGTPDPYDGVVVHYYVFGRTGNVATGHIGRTGTHEVGHWLGLYHTFDYGTCAGSDSSDCAASGDFICDTPGDNTPDYGCSQIVNDCADTPMDYPDQTENYMDYSDDPCRQMFSLGQIGRMRGFLFTTRNSLLTSLGCVPPGSPYLDASAIQILNLPSETCSPMISPVLLAGNGSPLTLNSLIVHFQMDAAPADSFSWTGSISAGSNDTICFPAVSVSPGFHHLLIWTSDPNGSVDQNSSNDSLLVSFNILSSGNGMSLPYEENFEAGQFPPAHWTMENPDNGQAWERTTEASSFGLGTASARFQNFYNGGTHTRDELVSPILDMSAFTNYMLSFDVAYSTPASTYYSDTLEIFSSTDCGLTWNSEYKEGGALLSTAPAPAVFSEFVPDSSQWRREYIPIHHLAGSSLVQFRFENRSNWGNDLYLDHISWDLSTHVTSETLNLQLYPNPASLWFRIDATVQGPCSVTLLDFTGRTVLPDRHFETVNLILPVDNLAPGTYFLLLRLKDTTIVRKVVINR